MARIICKVVPLVVACCTFVNLGIAGEAENQDSASLLHKHTWQVGPEISYFKYKEPGVMTEEGSLYGLGGTYTYRPWADANDVAVKGGNMLRLDGRLSFGQVDYDGSLLDGTPYTMKNIDDSLFELRVLGGRDYLRSTSLTSFYFGLGYRYLNDDASSDPVGYQRESNYLYLPLGVEYTHQLSEGGSLTPRAEVDILIVGRQVSHMSDSDPSLHDVTNDQTSGYALRASVRFQKRFGGFALALDPFVTYWNVSESKDKVEDGITYYEPKNWSLEYGLGFIFMF
jgi:hypothetical protein